jgi:hypothetical protein
MTRKLHVTITLSLLPPFCYVHESVHCNNILVYKSQQDAHVTEFIDMDMSYTRVLHPKVAHSVSHK